MKNAITITFLADDEGFTMQALDSALDKAGYRADIFRPISPSQPFVWKLTRNDPKDSSDAWCLKQGCTLKLEHIHPEFEGDMSKIARLVRTHG